MSKPRERWWGYVKACLRSYPELRRNAEALRGQSRREYEAVRDALAETERLPDGPARMELARLVLTERVCSLDGAALRLHISTATARRWHQSVIRLTARRLGLTENFSAEMKN